MELDLADRWNVSQSTIRAALKTLHHEGLVEYRPRRGNFVSRFGSEDIPEIYTLRSVLEALGARLAAGRATASDCARLKEVLRSMRAEVKPTNRRRAMDLDFQFHRLIIEISGRRRLADIYASLEAQTRLFLAMTDQFHEDLSGILASHEPIAKAIFEGKEGVAFDLAVRVNEPDGERLMAVMREMERDDNNGAQRRTRRTPGDERKAYSTTRPRGRRA